MAIQRQTIQVSKRITPTPGDNIYPAAVVLDAPTPSLRMIPTFGAVDVTIDAWKLNAISKTEMVQAVQAIDEMNPGDPRLAALTLRLMPRALLRIRQLERLLDSKILGV